MKFFCIFRKKDNYLVHKYYLESLASLAMSVLSDDEFEIRVYNTETEEWEMQR